MLFTIVDLTFSWRYDLSLALSLSLSKEHLSARTPNARPILIHAKPESEGVRQGEPNVFKFPRKFKFFLSFFLTVSDRIEVLEMQLPKYLPLMAHLFTLSCNLNHTFYYILWEDGLVYMCKGVKTEPSALTIVCIWSVLLRRLVEYSNWI